MIRIYNTKTRTKEDFVSKELGKIGMYVCGPTVYNYIHIGNARTFIVFDVIRRYLKWHGFDVRFVQNITDVDDKIINKANEEGRSAAEVAAEYTQAFIDDMHAVGVLDPDVRPKATEEIPEMIELVEQLIEGGHAYVADGDVYFSVRSFPEYGALSGRNVDEMETGHRELRAEGQGLEDRKQDALDFALWKAAKPGEPSWESPWGQGRPGWHIECSAMSRKYLGLPFDIHGGGADLCFPHHENEMAQSCAAYGEGFANYWIHSGMLQIKNKDTGETEKMSKSLGNFLLLRDVLQEVPANVLRMLCVQTHYRSPMEFSSERLDEAKAALERIESLLNRIDWACENAQDIPSPFDTKALEATVRDARVDFIVAMDDDFNTAGGLGVIFGLVSDLNTELGDKTISVADVPVFKEIRHFLADLMNIFGVELGAKAAGANSYPAEVLDLARELTSYAGDSAEEAVQALLDARAAARAAKDFATADAVRDGLVALGFVIEDTPQGARVTFAS
ncbi:MAG: cysteine--tRNA ligase [Eggerthellaceae bacterium]|nr:cysteine--tRNA ligase [Eggerthellaceae bacterium]